MSQRDEAKGVKRYAHHRDQVNHWPCDADCFSGMHESSSGRWVRLTDHLAELDSLRARVREFEALGQPITEDFLDGVRREALYQRQRWGLEYDARKGDDEWFWLVGYLAGKALHTDAMGGDAEKQRHRIIAAAAALANWHAATQPAPRGETDTEEQAVPPSGKPDGASREIREFGSMASSASSDEPNRRDGELEDPS